jgi:hypothetical protein
VPGQRFSLVRAISAGASLLGLLTAAPALAWSPYDLFAPCAGDCATAIYWGDYVETSMVDIFGDPIPPNEWDFRNDSLIATAVSRNAGHWKRLTFEPEVGIGQRYGKQDETELWAALFVRYHGFPWDDYLTTTFALSTGLNWATGVSEIEQERARDGEGSQLMHFFSPEITFALPSRPNVQLLFRIHHRSGVFGLVSDAWGGAQYGTFGFRVWF